MILLQGLIDYKNRTQLPEIHVNKIGLCTLYFEIILYEVERYSVSQGVSIEIVFIYISTYKIKHVMIFLPSCKIIQ